MSAILKKQMPIQYTMYAPRGLLVRLGVDTVDGSSKHEKLLQRTRIVRGTGDVPTHTAAALMAATALSQLFKPASKFNTSSKKQLLVVEPQNSALASLRVQGPK